MCAFSLFGRRESGRVDESLDRRDSEKMRCPVWKVRQRGRITSQKENFHGGRILGLWCDQISFPSNAQLPRKLPKSTGVETSGRNQTRKGGSSVRQEARP